MMHYSMDIPKYYIAGDRGLVGTWYKKKYPELEVILRMQTTCQRYLQRQIYNYINLHMLLSMLGYCRWTTRRLR